jgi:hypothetical protein
MTRKDENSRNFKMLLLFKRNVWLMDETYDGLIIQMIAKVRPQ